MEQLVNSYSATELRFELGAGISAVACILIGAFVFSIRLLELPIDVLPLPNIPAMAINTALGFMFAGVSLLLLHRSFSAAPLYYLQRLLALAVGALGLFSLLESLYPTAISLGWLYINFFNISSAYVFPSSSPTAGALLLSGMALWLVGSQSDKQVFAGQVVAVVVILLSTSLLINYLYGARPFYQVDSLIGLGINNGSCFMLLSLGLICVRPHVGLAKSLSTDDISAKLLRMFLPVIIVSPVLLAVLEQIGSEKGLYDVHLGATMLTSMNIGLLLVVTLFMARHVYRQEHKKMIAQQQFQDLFEHAANAMVVCDSGGKIVRVNAKTEELYGYDRGEMLGEPIEVMLPNNLRAGHLNMRNRYFEEPRYLTLRDLTAMRKDGSSFPAGITLNPVRSNGDLFVTVSIIDFTSQKQAEEELRYLASHDSLTGLSTRRVLEESINHAIAHARRYKRHAALMFLDLDNFKELNDEYGHEVGDLALKEFAQRLRSSVRAEDNVIRFGGDEFVVVLNDLASSEDAALIARKISATSRKPLQTHVGELYLYCSIGISCFPDDGRSMRELIHNADRAMYASKGMGSNRFKFSSAIESQN